VIGVVPSNGPRHPIGGLTSSADAGFEPCEHAAAFFDLGGSASSDCPVGSFDHLSNVRGRSPHPKRAPVRQSRTFGLNRERRPAYRAVRFDHLATTNRREETSRRILGPIPYVAECDPLRSRYVAAVVSADPGSGFRRADRPAACPVEVKYGSRRSRRTSDGAKRDA